MSLKQKVMGSFFFSLSLAMVLFLFFFYYAIHEGWYAGISAQDMTAALQEFGRGTQKAGTKTDWDVYIAKQEKTHPDMHFAVLENGSFVSKENLPEISSFTEAAAVLNEGSRTIKGYKVKAFLQKTSPEYRVIFCYVPEKKYEALSYEINMARGSGIFGKLALMGVLFTIVIMLLVWQLISRGFFKRIQELLHAMSEIDNSHLDVHLMIKGKDEIAQLAGGFNKMTERLKESISREKKYEESRKQLVSDISHDLRTPLSSVLGYAEMLKNGYYEDEAESNKYIDIIHRKSKYMNFLLSELLEYSRLEMQSIQLHKESVDLAEFLRETIIEYMPAIEKNGYIVDVSLAEHAVNIEADANYLKRVFYNIYDNVLKYGMDGKKFRLELIEEEHCVKVLVRDYGKGMDEESVRHMKERFYRSDCARNSATGGMGLGMYIADEIVKLHGGEFDIRNADGEGMVFTVTLNK